MAYAFKRLFLGLFLIVLASSVLLISDWHRRKPVRGKVPRVAICQFVTSTILEESVKGCLDAFAQRGYAPGQTVRIERFNAERDLPTANMIAKSVVDGNYDLIVTFSTPSLQTVAAANLQGKVRHVFGAVTDPYTCGVGFNRGRPLDHPKYLAGIGTFQPVKEVFLLARKCFPGLKRVGVVWCTSESCSLACTELAREVCRELGIELLEAPVESSVELIEATKALAAKDVQAIWVGGDNVVESSVSSVINTATEAGIPVFTNTPEHVNAGALISLGADYYEVGKTTGNLAVDILKGRDPATVALENVVPQKLGINLSALSKIHDSWNIPDDMKGSASILIDTDGRQSMRLLPAAGLPDEKKYKIAMAYFAPEMGVEIAMQGLLDGLREQGLQEGVNLTVTRAHAQAEMANIQPILQNFDNSDVDAIATFTTPVLQGACATVRSKPVVFNYVTDPIAAGAGTTLMDHLPFMTGVGGFPPLEETVSFIDKIVPGFKKLGVLYNSGEANSVKVVTVLRELCMKNNITLEEGTLISTSEAAQAIQALLAREIQAFYLPGDNTAYQAFEVIIRETQEARIPCIIDQVEFVGRGALAAIGVRYYYCAKRAGLLLARVLRGENPAAIPMENVSVSQIALNEEIAKKISLRFSPEVLKMAKDFGITGKPAAGPGPDDRSALPRLWKLSLIQQVESPAIDTAKDGLLAGLKEAGLVEGRDYRLQVRDAQGELSLLGSLVDASLDDDADMILTITSPVLQTVMQKVKDRPVVYTLAVSPLILGDKGTDEKHRMNIAGVYDRSPFEAMMKLIRECLPEARTIGTLYAPSEVNSVDFYEQMKKAAKAAGYKLVAEPSGTSADVGEAALALIQQGADVICQINDNLHDSAFASIVSAAGRARVPVFAFSSGLARQGASVTLANDHFDGGRESGLIAARIMRGEAPASIPYHGITKTKLAVNPGAAQAVNFTIPDAVIRRADEVVQARGSKGN
ncbi:MAG: ABC transporter substrate-binding protein [Candidatus Omnitrophica bacterium]|nr:ABC transporter substrate-binding protein [Candidatus Omnitrophota bacterium]